MSPLSKKYKKSYALVLLKISEGDLESAKALMDAKIGRPENIVYHCQQVIEKVLKSVLCHMPPDAHALGSLSQYATIRKYEEGSEILTHEDFEACYELAKSVLEWGKKLISES